MMEFVVCFVGRTFGIIIMAFLFIKRKGALTMRESFLISYYGTIRGAVTFALTLKFAGEFTEKHQLESFYL